MSVFVLSEEQYAAATSEKNHLLIVAPPGCGKTEVLAHRVAHQIDLLKPNQRVLALTFTKRARANLEERLRSVLGQTQARRQVVVRNFHGFATQVVLAHGRTIGLRMDDLEMPKTSTMRRAMEAAGGGGAIYEAERLLAEIKRSPLSDAEVLEKIDQRQRSEATLLAAKVEWSRQEANQLHYDDLLRHAQRLLRIPAVARLYQTHFGAVLVDEFQDLSLQQFDISILSCTDRRTFAGDPHQGIYSWAGAAPVEVEAEVRRTCGDPIMLRESYRSSPMVLEAVNSISEQVDPESGLVSAIPEKWPGGGCSAALVLQDQAAEAALAVRLATSIHRAVPDASIGIIARAGWRRKIIDAAFVEQTDVPVRRWELAIDDPATVALIQRSVGPGVHLLNAHTGKGQQFDWAIVVGLEEGHLPGKRNSHGDALDEEQRVLLVMLSRARHGLVVTRTCETDGWYGPKPVVASRWWSEIKARYSSEEEIQSHIEELRCLRTAAL